MEWRKKNHLKVHGKGCIWGGMLRGVKGIDSDGLGENKHVEGEVMTQNLADHYSSF